MTNPQKFKPRPVANDRVKKRGLLWGLVTAGDPSPKPGQRSGVNGPGPPRPAGEPGARGGTPGRGLALPGPDGELAKKRCPNAHLAQRRRLGRVAALPAPCRDRTWACHATGDGMEAVGFSPNLHTM